MLVLWNLLSQSLDPLTLWVLLLRLKDPGLERTESRTRTATRTSSKTAVRCSAGQHTRGDVLQWWITLLSPLPSRLALIHEQDAVSHCLTFLPFQCPGQKRTHAGGHISLCNTCCPQQQQPNATNHGERRQTTQCGDTTYSYTHTQPNSTKWKMSSVLYNRLKQLKRVFLPLELFYIANIFHHTRIYLCHHLLNA